MQGIKIQADNEAKTRQFEFDGQMQNRKQEFDEQAVSRKQGFEERTRANELMPDEDFKQYYANKVAQSDVMPSVMQGLTQAFAQLNTSLQRIAELQEQTITVIKAPKVVSLGTIEKDAEGRISGATVKSAPVILQ